MNIHTTSVHLYLAMTVHIFSGAITRADDQVCGAIFSMMLVSYRLFSCHQHLKCPTTVGLYSLLPDILPDSRTITVHKNHDVWIKKDQKLLKNSKTVSTEQDKPNSSLRMGVIRTTHVIPLRCVHTPTQNRHFVPQILPPRFTYRSVSTFILFSKPTLKSNKNKLQATKWQLS